MSKIKQINARINFLTIVGFILILRIMQLNPTNSVWSASSYIFMTIGLMFLLAGDLL